MITMRFRISAALAAFALMSACQREAVKDTTAAPVQTAKDTTADPEPFWQAKPSIPYKPSNFCSTNKRLMTSLPASTNFICVDYIGGGLGARVDVSNVQIVLLQGANSEWFMFAYELQEGGRSAVSAQMLQRLQNEIEQALQMSGHD